MEKKEEYWDINDIVDSIQDAMLKKNSAYAADFADPATCDNLWKAYHRYADDMSMDDMANDAVDKWMQGILNEYIDGNGCPAGPRSNDT